MLIASLLLSATLDATTPTQSAYVGTSPVRVAACAIDPVSPAIELPFGSSAGVLGYTETAISFVNTDPRPIRSVIFEVNDGHQSSQITDKGTFSNGVEISHIFVTPQFGYALGGATCKVQAVAFADGSTWQAQ